MNVVTIEQWIAMFCFAYPFVAAFYWMGGGMLFYVAYERHKPPPEQPPTLDHAPPVSVLVPCFNEAEQLEETFEALTALSYPDYEIVAIDDGSTDATPSMLDALAARFERVRVVHLRTNQGKAMALNVGALAARHEILVCIDGDTLLERSALAWFVHRFLSAPAYGSLAGNPRVRNRRTLLGRLQVGEFSSIVGLVKRAQNSYGSFFTVSGAVCAFRKRALHDAGWWNRAAMTEDVDVSWRLQLAGWRIGYEPNAMGWILVPETLRGLWRQRVRWSGGGSTVMAQAIPQLFRWGSLRMWPIWLNYLAAVAWAYACLGMVLLWVLSATGVSPFPRLQGFGVVLGPWGMVLALTFLLQSLVSLLLDRRLERGMLRASYWVVWYPLAFWVLQASAAVVGPFKAATRPRKAAGTWTSPDRGLR